MWSLIDDTPRGVTLHYIDCDLDKGLIIAQELDSDLNALETLKTTYDRLDFLAVEMFKKAFRYYRFWPQMQKQALGKGTYHTDKQGELLRKCIDDYDIKCDEFIRRYKEIVNVEK
jgi:methionyl-tRNA formyltransferase